MDKEQKNDFATLQTAAGYPKISETGTDYIFSSKEVAILQELAQRVWRLSQRDIEKEKARLWTLHNDLKPERPMVFADPENGWNELIPAANILCSDPLARIWEMSLRKQIYWAEKFLDDKVIEPYFDVPFVYSESGWGVELKKHGGENSGSYIVDPAVSDYEMDLPKVRYPEILIDQEESERIYELALDVFGKILQVRRQSTWWWTLGMTWEFINLRGLENLMMDLILEPEAVHATMKLLSEGTLRRLEWLEENGVLSSNTQGTYVGSGGFGWTSELPKPSEIKGSVKTSFMWGFCESQETVGVSPEMFNEFILPYQLPILEKFGLNCYGCCEPIDVRWEYVRKIPRLRRVSASPWANKAKLSEYLEDRYIMSVKPSPTPLAAPVLDEDVVRAELRETLAQTKGCVTEFIMKDNHTLGNNPDNILRWIEIAREEIERA